MAKYIVIAGAVPMLHDRKFKADNLNQLHPDNRKLTADNPYVKMGDVLDENFFKDGEIGELLKGEFIKPQGEETAAPEETTETENAGDGGEETSEETAAKKSKAKA